MSDLTKRLLELFLQEIIKILENDLKKVILYGSYARGDFHGSSDVDIMVLTSRSEDEIRSVE